MKKREKAYDLLRILAAFSVVVLHCSAQFWYVLPVGSREWMIANFYDGCFRFGVPIFVMISGALFLGRTINLKRLYFHNILRIAVIFLVWSVFYVLISLFAVPGRDMDTTRIVKAILEGSYHEWFLKMLICIYMTLPLLNTWVKNASRRDLDYFLLCFLGARIVPFTLGAFYRGYFYEYLQDLFANSEIGIFAGYTGYFVLGYYIVRFGFPEKIKKFLYWGMVPMLLAGVATDSYLAIQRGEPQGLLYDSFGVSTFFVSAALFTLFVEKYRNEEKGTGTNRLLSEMADSTLGIYMLHLAMMNFLRRKGFTVMTFDIMIGIPLLSVLLFVSCGVISFILRKIPFVGRYLC